MDLFCEFLMKKKSASDNLKRFGLWAACILVCFLIFYLSFFHFHAIITIMPITIAALIYGTVIYGRNFSLEYEYVFTNGVLDIDVIKGRARRKRLVSIPCRKIENMEKLRHGYHSDRKVINAIYDEHRSGKYVVTFSDNGVMTDVYFQPPEKLLQNMQKYNPRNIHL
ncbi:MAG: hypothetical protein IJ367_04520 [Clostridia bacterium]|nr:hypothetical protein [Clostridia bacterium]